MNTIANQPVDDLAGGADEDTVDEKFRALMEGLRTSLPAVQVLFAFLLTAPLQSRFADLPQLEKTAFSIAFYASGLASALLIAPSIHQRLRAPSTGVQRRSERHLLWAIWLGIVGSVAMGVAMLATVFMVSAIVFDNDAAALATGVLATILAWSWFYLPLVTFNHAPTGPRR